MIYIGIDCGKNTGIAICYDGKIKLINSDFWHAFHYIKDTFDTEKTKVIIEDPSKIRTIYAKNRHQSKMATAKIAQDVGGVKRESELLADGLEWAGFLVERVKPNNTKKDAKTIKRITGYGGRSNEHTRDALMLVYGL